MFWGQAGLVPVVQMWLLWCWPTPDVAGQISKELGASRELGMDAPGPGNCGRDAPLDLPALQGCSGARLLCHFPAPRSGAGLAERNVEFGLGGRREGGSFSCQHSPCAHRVTSFSCARANLLLPAGEKPQLHCKAK